METLYGVEFYGGETPNRMNELYYSYEEALEVAKSACDENCEDDEFIIYEIKPIKSVSLVQMG